MKKKYPTKWKVELLGGYLGFYEYHTLFLSKHLSVLIEVYKNKNGEFKKANVSVWVSNGDIPVCESKNIKTSVLDARKIALHLAADFLGSNYATIELHGINNLIHRD